MRRSVWAVLASAGLVLALSCDEDEIVRLDQQPFEGIREFDMYCQLVGGDTTDFVPRPIVCVDTTAVPPIACPPRSYSLVAACPNPTQGATTNITFVIPMRDSVWLFVYDRTNSPPIDTLYARTGPPGMYGIHWTNPTASGILRVEMNTGSGFRSHGDVLFTP